MKTRIVFFRAITLAFLAAAAFLSPRAQADDAPPAPKPTGKCMMWKVSSKTATVYLLGSMHMATPEMFPLPKEMEEAFSKSDTLVVEVNINKVDKAKLLQLVLEKGTYKGDETLSGSVKKETLEKLKDAGVPVAFVDKLKPWYVGLIVEAAEIQKLGFDPTLGVDKHFLDLADKQGKKIDELESAEFQLDQLSGFDPKMQEASLLLTLAEMKDLKDDLTKLTDAWVAGDKEALNELMTDKEKDHPETKEVVQKLIYDRNGPMAEKVEGYLKGDKTVMVIAGCAHMVGDKGIVKILENDKFTVEQSPSTKPAKAEKEPAEGK
jgi:uncharacterized protein YbaP (TraB family)